MKRLIIVITIIFVTISYADRKIDIKRHGAGENGKYNDISESHDDGGWFRKAESKLTCTNPGNSACAWINHPDTRPGLVTDFGTPIDVDDMQDHAEDQITAGTLNGSYNNNLFIDGEFWYRNVTWNASSTTGGSATITIDITKSTTN